MLNKLSTFKFEYQLHMYLSLDPRPTGPEAKMSCAKLNFNKIQKNAVQIKIQKYFWLIIFIWIFFNFNFNYQVKFVVLIARIS